jgi:hypothetical protein
MQRKRRRAGVASGGRAGLGRGAFFAQPGAGSLTHPGGVIGGPFPFEWLTPPPGSPPDDWPWPVESPGPFPEARGDASGVP